jgi:DMSO/TMAO reductase YedYZ molybdopterin-dependent catalytic subunit
VYEALIVPAARPGFGASARYVIVSALDGMRAGLPIADALADDVLLADTMDGAPLSAEHGAPLRLVAPAHVGYKSVKHVSAIDFASTNFTRGFTALRSIPADAWGSKSVGDGAPVDCCGMSTAR